MVWSGCGREHTLVALASGGVYSWGWGEGGRLGLGEVDAVLSPRRVEEVRGREGEGEGEEEGEGRRDNKRRGRRRRRRRRCCDWCGERRWPLRVKTVHEIEGEKYSGVFIGRRIQSMPWLVVVPVFGILSHGAYKGRGCSPFARTDKHSTSLPLNCLSSRSRTPVRQPGSENNPGCMRARALPRRVGGGSALRLRAV